jgi:signal peptidase
MNGRQIVSWTLQITLIVVVLVLIAGQFLGQPILLSFVETGSMEPTIDTGDGFVAIPTELAGEIGEGDVVVFEAEEIQGGGLTTHRIVGETEQGYITRGDANPFTDQDSDEPPVQKPQIVAVAWQPGGDVFTIPGLGTVVNGIQSVLESLQVWLAQLFGTRAFLGLQGVGYLLFGASLLLYLLAVYLEDDRRRERTSDRDTGTSSRKLMAVLTLVVVAGATAAMVAPAQNQEFGIVSAEFESDSPDVIQQGTSDSFDYRLRNTGVVPTVVFLESNSENLAVEPGQTTLSPRSTANATVTITAPPETGYYRTFLEQHRYLRILPTPVIEELYAVHPWAPIVVIDAVVAVPFYLFGMWLLGTGRLRSRNRKRTSWLS